MYQVIFYTTARGESPIDEFLDGLDKKSKAKVEAYLPLLEEQGPDLKRPYADHVRGKIRELRVRYSGRHYRILYSFHGTNQIVLVHAFAKKTQQLRENDIALAEHRMENWKKHHPVGG